MKLPKNEYIIWGLILTIIIFDFISDIIISELNRAKLEIEGKETYATVTTNCRSNSCSYFRVQFFVDGIGYENICPSSMSVVKGSKFKVEYLPKNPEIFRILFDKPVFLENEKTALTIGILKNVNLLSSGILVFTYIVNKKKYIIYYYVKETVKKHLKDGMKFKVEYWIYNPRRCIVHFDKNAN